MTRNVVAEKTERDAIHCSEPVFVRVTCQSASERDCPAQPGSVIGDSGTRVARNCTSRVMYSSDQ